MGRDDNGIILGYSCIYDTSSGNLLHRYGKWTIEISNLPLQIVIFHSYVNLPEGSSCK